MTIRDCIMTWSTLSSTTYLCLQNRRSNGHVRQLSSLDGQLYHSHTGQKPLVLKPLNVQAAGHVAGQGARGGGGAGTCTAGEEKDEGGGRKHRLRFQQPRQSQPRCQPLDLKGEQQFILCIFGIKRRESNVITTRLLQLVRWGFFVVVFLWSVSYGHG